MVVNLTVSVNGTGSRRRGDVRIDLKSPSGTQSALLNYRSNDNSFFGKYYRWPFMSLAFWGENPNGTWELTITSQSPDTDIDYSDVYFQFYGTSTTPEAVSRIPEQCHSNCARGCAAEGSMYCDACVKLRNAYTLECIDECPSGYTARNGYCYNTSQPESVCTSTTPTPNLGTAIIKTCTES